MQLTHASSILVHPSTSLLMPFYHGMKVQGFGLNDESWITVYHGSRIAARGPPFLLSSAERKRLITS
jgi:hypothetical protein